MDTGFLSKDFINTEAVIEKIKALNSNEDIYIFTENNGDMWIERVFYYQRKTELKDEAVVEILRRDEYGDTYKRDILMYNKKTGCSLNYKYFRMFKNTLTTFSFEKWAIFHKNIIWYKCNSTDYPRLNGYKEYQDLGLIGLDVKSLFDRNRNLLDIYMNYIKFQDKYIKLIDMGLDIYINSKSLNLEGNTFEEIFKIHVRYEDSLKQGLLTLNEAKSLNRLKTDASDVTMMRTIRHHLADFKIIRHMNTKEDLHKFYYYLEKVISNNELGLYRDYLFLCQSLEKNIYDSYWLMPNNIGVFYHRLLDTYIESYDNNMMKNSYKCKEKKHFNDALLKMARMHEVFIRNKNLKIAVASNVDEIISNGEKLEIGVGNVLMPYIDNMADNKNLILFAYDNEEPIEYIEYDWQNNQLVTVSGKGYLDSNYHQEILDTFKDYIGASL